MTTDTYRRYGADIMVPPSIKGPTEARGLELAGYIDVSGG